MTKIQKINHHYTWLVLVVVVLIIGAVLIREIRLGDNQLLATAATEPTMSVMVGSTAYPVGTNFNAEIVIDTASMQIDSVDVYSLRYNPNFLKVVDDNPNLAGAQITPGTLLANTSQNIVDETNGLIQFSQSMMPTTYFSGNGVLATVHFQTIAAGISNLVFDFTAGSTTDSNFAYQGTDLLANVVNAALTVDATRPTVAISSPLSNATVSGSVSVVAEASDNTGISGVQFKLDGANIATLDTTSPYSIVWNSASVSNGSHSLTATGTDLVGLTTSNTITINVNNLASNQNPVGAFESISKGYVKGWSYDPDYPSVSDQIRVYIDGDQNTGKLLASFATNLTRKDINRTYKISGNHGFNYQVPALYRDGLQHTIYVYAVDYTDPAHTVLLNGSPKTFNLKR